MGKQSSHNTRGFRKRKTPYKVNPGTKRSRVEEDNVANSPSSTSSGELRKGESNGVTSDEEEMVYQEPSMYDKLLMKLGSSSKSVAAAYKLRKRQEEGLSDSENDEDDGTESSSDSEEGDDDEEGNPKDSEMAGIEEESEDYQETSDIEKESDDAETEYDQETSDFDDEDAYELDLEQDLRINHQSAAEASICLSSFDTHLGHKLTKGEVENLLKKKWTYEWEVPAVGMSKGKWAGTGECFIKDENPNSDSGLKQKLYTHWLDVYNTSGGKDFHLCKQRLFFSLFNSYRDVLHCNKKPFYHRGSDEDSSVMDAYIMHCLNHVFRTRDLVTKNDAKVSKRQETTTNEILTDNSFLDHGFTRPKVLIILPIASIALRVVKRLIQLTPSAHKVNVEHMDRFSREFGIEEDHDNEEEGGQDFGNVKPHKSSKPGDFQILFGGNSKDDFMVGIKFTKRSIKLYSDFYTSDVIVASTVGLLKKIDEAKLNKEKDVDYLSSIEVLIIDHADVITMQNWSFLKSVVEQLNHIPSKQHGTDVMRIRPWYLDGYASFYRQTILLSYYSNPDINSLFNKQCNNYHGKVKLVHEHKGVLPKVVLQVRQIYQRFDAESIEHIDDARFEYFTTKVFPKIKDSIEGGIMIFISSYFEYVRVRNFLKSQSASFCLLHEYAEQSDISRARVRFFEGKRKIMLYTERAHFYHRYKIRGLQNLIIYSLPERKEFYPEVVNMLDGSRDMACTVLFSHFDLLRLERIVGMAPARRMVTSKMSMFSFS